jgi:hypothetical protein
LIRIFHGLVWHIRFIKEAETILKAPPLLTTSSAEAFQELDLQGKSDIYFQTVTLKNIRPARISL